MSRRKCYNPERRAWRGVSHKTGGRVRDLRDRSKLRSLRRERDPQEVSLLKRLG